MSKFRFIKNLLPVAIATGFAASAHADWGAVCSGPTPRTSADYGGQFIISPLFAAFMGVSGTYAYNGAGPPPGCFANGLTVNVRGRIGFGAGSLGTIQSGLDDFMGFTWGWLGGIGGSTCYAIIREDDAPSLFGANGFSTTFTGASDTYFFGRTTNGNVQIDLRVDLVGDSARLNWKLSNTDTAAAHQIALGFGSTVSLFSEATGTAKGVGPGPVTGGTYVTVPGIKPPRTERRWTRSTDPTNYPGSVFFNWDQENAVGIRIENSPNDATTDLVEPAQSQTPNNSFVVGQALFLLGWASGGDPADFNNVIFEEPISDVTFAGRDAYIQFWDNQLVAVGASRTINAYYRSVWGDSMYGRPYSVVVDTPKVINLNSGDANQFAQNPFTIRVWVDNNRGFSTIDQELPLQDVQVQLLLPDGLSTVGASTKTITRIDARQQGFINFTVQADDFAAGDLTYQVKVTPTPGPQKTITGTITVVSQPKLTLQADANLITSPWSFDTPTWETILGLTPDADYQAFFWDPQQKGYIVSTGPERGRGAWIVNRIGTTSFALQGNPKAPTDYKPTFDGSGGAPLIELKPGWNLVGNPYHVSFQLGEMVGASNSNPNQAYTYADLVKQGLISAALAYWDTGTQNYGYIQKATDHVEPQKGYWVFVYASQSVFIRFPPIFQVGVRSTDNSKPWQQTEKQWRMQLAVRSNNSADDQNFIGIASSPANAKSLRINKPPMAPVKNALSLSIDKTIDGVATRLAQSLSETSGKQEFTVNVDVKPDPTKPTDKQTLTMTWPNLSTIPKNVRVRLVDTVTNESRDLRKVSGYTFTAEPNLTRVFKIQVEPGTVSKAIIGSVIVSGSTKSGPNAAIRLNYTLSSDATTSVRILGATGKEIMTIAAGRADKVGQNEVVWNLRDQANRSVAPGSYRAEIVAEGADGERVRKIVPIIVVR